MAGHDVEDRNEPALVAAAVAVSSRRRVIPSRRAAGATIEPRDHAERVRLHAQARLRERHHRRHRVRVQGDVTDDHAARSATNAASAPAGRRTREIVVPDEDRIPVDDVRLSLPAPRTRRDQSSTRARITTCPSVVPSYP